MGVYDNFLELLTGISCESNLFVLSMAAIAFYIFAAFNQAKARDYKMRMYSKDIDWNIDIKMCSNLAYVFSWFATAMIYLIVLSLIPADIFAEDGGLDQGWVWGVFYLGSAGIVGLAFATVRMMLRLGRKLSKY